MEQSSNSVTPLKSGTRRVWRIVLASLGVVIVGLGIAQLINSKPWRSKTLYPTRQVFLGTDREVVSFLQAPYCSSAKAITVTRSKADDKYWKKRGAEPPVWGVECSPAVESDVQNVAWMTRPNFYIDGTGSMFFGEGIH